MLSRILSISLHWNQGHIKPHIIGVYEMFSIHFVAQVKRALKNLMTGFFCTAFSVHCISSLFKIKKDCLCLVIFIIHKNMF
jgi:hypothetical protein